LVNNYITAITEENLEAGIGTVRQAAAENLDMELYFKLIIEKFRAGVVLRYAPKIEHQMAADLSEEDLAFLRSLTKKSARFTSKTLAILLREYQNMNNAFIKELPLELALLEIFKTE